MEEYKEIERSIIVKYRKEIWRKFTRAIKDFELIKDGDKVAVCISGGKDSFLLAKCIEELQKHGKVNFEAKYIVMNPGYNKDNKDKIIENAKKLNIDIEVFESNIFDSVYFVKQGSPCYLCARMRRGYLYSYAKEKGCNKIALGHHFDDVIETVLLNMFYGSELKSMMPKLHSDNFEGMELIRPMYYIREDDIKSWARYNKLSFLNCACRFTEENNETHNENSKRLEMKMLIKELKKNNPLIENSIFKSVQNINLNTIIEYKKDGIKHNFLEEYDKELNDTNESK